MAARLSSFRQTLSPLISKIEIERKFLPTRPLLHALTRTTTVPALPPSIARAHPATVHFIRDVYYDRHDERLAAEGVWVRRRSVIVGDGCSTSSWEAKVSVGGNFAASQFVEVEGAEAVEREMQRALGGDRVAVDKIGEHLAVMSDLTTRRLSGRLELRYEDDKNDNNGAPLQNLTVAIDQVVETTGGDFAAARAVLERMPARRDGDGDGNLSIHSSPDLFFHEIGELELMEEVRTEAAAFGKSQHEQEHETHRKAVAAARAAQLEAFMRAHAALFPMTPRPRGKLSAYAAWSEERVVAAAR
ncbi:hypothetical protein DFH08DRAFT_84286 [Mycena albidolilacea]|uniref:CYTH domain-containing protein n=1 Tax=Mycena albidolilacea TaxID=1033008 RepID=A0AAD7A9U3_9AGAR|nr:hypothetical protein DFH08DRAFT_84286 [Mycena albidolilacea]